MAWTRFLSFALQDREDGELTVVGWILVCMKLYLVQTLLFPSWQHYHPLLTEEQTMTKTVKQFAHTPSWHLLEVVNRGPVLHPLAVRKRLTSVPFSLWALVLIKALQIFSWSFNHIVFGLFPKLKMEQDVFSFITDICCEMYYLSAIKHRKSTRLKTKDGIMYTAPTIMGSPISFTSNQPECWVSSAHTSVQQMAKLLQNQHTRQKAREWS